MKILIVTLNHVPELTGIGRYVGEMVQWLSARGHQIQVVCAPPYYPEWRVAAGYSAGRYRRERVGPTTVVRCPLYVPRRPTGFTRLLHLASFALSSAPVTLAIAWRWRPHVVFVVEPPLACAPIAALAARAAGARSWLHVQDFEVDAAFGLGLLGRGRALATALERAVMRCFDRVSTISEAMDRRLADKGVVDDRRTSFPNWVDTAFVRPHDVPSPYRAAWGVDANRRVALYSGNLGRKQGVDLLVDAARHLREDAGTVMVICGDGADRERLQAAAAGFPNILFQPLQPAERLAELLNAADVHLLPQRAEAEDLVMPSKLAAMMASGRPVVATAWPGSEVARTVEARGVVVPPGDAAAFAAAIRSLCADDDRRRRLGAAARAHAERAWDKEAVLGRVLGSAFDAWAGARTTVAG